MGITWGGEGEKEGRSRFVVVSRFCSHGRICCHLSFLFFWQNLLSSLVFVLIHGRIVRCADDDVDVFRSGLV